MVDDARCRFMMVCPYPRRAGAGPLRSLKRCAARWTAQHRGGGSWALERRCARRAESNGDASGRALSSLCFKTPSTYPPELRLERATAQVGSKHLTHLHVYTLTYLSVNCFILTLNGITHHVIAAFRNLQTGRRGVGDTMGVGALQRLQSGPDPTWSCCPFGLMVAAPTCCHVAVRKGMACR